MNNEIKRGFIPILKKVVELFVAKNYFELVDLVESRGLSKEDVDQLQKYMEGFPVTLMLPPDDAYERIDVFEVENCFPRQWSVDMQLWTIEEGASDLYLILGFTELGDRLEAEFVSVRPL